MRRAVCVCLIAFVFASTAGPALAVTSPPPRAALDGFVCERASNALDRVIAVVGVMRPVTGTQRMQMRFVLQRRDAVTNSFTVVQGGDLGRWRSPTPATLGQQPNDVWRLRKLVANLPGPATYRFRVTFRWLGTSNTVLGRSTLTSGTCSQPQ
ncbi:MAG TPA: hypothetical protein VMD09_04015 [Solirubrobacteraceae bacterium]|nr:hypothetical protein [Solirubrobacteraceae bacterium]